MTPRSTRLTELYKSRPRDRVLRLNAAAVAVLVVAAIWQLDVPWGDVFSATRAANLRRFAGEVYPYALRDQPFSAASLGAWCLDIWSDRGREAAAATLAISVVAIILAGGSALLVLVPASRTLATPGPLLPSGCPPPRIKRWWWRSVVAVVRALLILVRSVPEYIWAFLLIAMLGLNAWPAVLALAIHNLGILGKLGADVVENLNPAPLRALRAQGMSRAQIAAVGVVPAALSKWLLFFFYRWESCIREATVLGMLGITSLGFWVRETRARDWYDEMLLFILLGAVLVLLVDVASALTRRYLRRT